MKLLTLLYTATSLLGIASADIEKRCTIGLDIECWYQGFYSNGDQVRCAVPGQYAIAYAYGECPNTYDGKSFAYSTCITAGKYNGRHKCSDSPAPDGNDPDDKSFGNYGGN
ncbi:hypothetical protein COCC4DRAFT_180939 [Bipolaris maydis ATCC 48331]|uniref:Uncharacterized protein n=2 Tax=Cochliobolus heterostrophus TaxID=5016 RepID=M2TTZ2_COCH5|nr:uncharacterized protein COCC4DRAFT_180939 [Bipolaris maydis ATCC 48331]EMD85236.1 hypothetical protein COCHEDRAFT_1229066 [Bipolaris maydis C5]KAH7548687.1 hypothetical protein BM1_10985 [Bipolaris maydis]ENH99479.1 hypothetical protein COCC4DRAFT_180939 [Bipolaris maydis ATCC 48331]KAJ5043197.1 hypothetical protein J3E74DRAFT_479187 [Bipolaris maydis]KAJ5058029.1 hypothetical protein J3E74DRAFT_419797 [Bipolaris maydis]